MYEHEVLSVYAKVACMFQLYENVCFIVKTRALFVNVYALHNIWTMGAKRC